jgi:hypothetical protein
MAAATAPVATMAPRIDLLECLADVFVGGVLCTLLALAIGFDSFVVEVRAAAEVTASPWLAFLLNLKL